MSKKSDLFEQNIANCANNFNSLPGTLPNWMESLGIKASSKIINASRIGSKSKDNKTDVLIELEDSTPIKISAKLSSADNFGNWYGHVRFLEEFGEETFYKLTTAITKWANSWITKPQASPFVGVSICFGRRTGETAIPFLDIFYPQDILSVVRGFGEECNSTANCMYISDVPPTSIDDLVNNLRPITHESIREATGKFMIACRPINPMTEGSNRGKNVYTQFIPFKALDTLTTVTTTNELRKLGSFHTVIPNRLNHNHILNNLEREFKLVVPRKKG